MWIKIVFASMLSGILMGFFSGFSYKTSASGLKDKIHGNTALGDWIRILRSQLFNKFAGWKIVPLRFFGLFVGMFVPMYIFFCIPAVSCKLTTMEFVIYLVLGMGFLKATDTL